MNPKRVKAASTRKTGKPDNNPLPNDAEGESPENEMVIKVFKLELLREMILDYVIHDQDSKQSRSNVRSCRLVGKAWLHSVSRILAKCQEPLFGFELSQLNATSSRGKPHKESFDHFVKFLSKKRRLEERVPSYAVNVWFPHLKKSTYQRFCNFLAKNGEGLVELKLIAFPTSNKWEPWPIKPELPKLRMLRVCLDTDPDSRFELAATAQATNFRRRSEIIPPRTSYIQAVLGVTRRLKTFWVSQYNPHMYGLTENFGTLILPSTLTHIKLNCVLNDDDLQVLVRNPLPKLTKLELVISERPFKDGVIASVLNNVRKTLKEFFLRRTLRYGDMTGPISFKFPLMEKLESLFFQVRYLELEQSFLFLKSQLPNIQRMSLCPQRYNYFCKWAARSCFDSVTSLTARLAKKEDRDADDVSVESDDDNEENYGNDSEHDSVSTMQVLCCTFPNLQELDLTWGLSYLSGVAVIWKELRSLKKLALNIASDAYVHKRDPLEPVLLGFSDERTETLRKSPEKWENAQIQDGVSIRNLTDLHTLELSAQSTRSYCFFVTDLAFHLAFFKMPRLKNLIFGLGIYEGKMMERWRKERCDERAQTIKYQNALNVDFRWYNYMESEESNSE